MKVLLPLGFFKAVVFDPEVSTSEIQGIYELVQDFKSIQVKYIL